MKFYMKVNDYLAVIDRHTIRQCGSGFYSPATIGGGSGAVYGTDQRFMYSHPAL